PVSFLLLKWSHLGVHSILLWRLIKIHWLKLLLMRCKKIYKKELGPQPVPITVPGEVVAEDD
ncbi:unnamed protein product, partial [Musa acuminata var. zebrina]